VVLADLTVCTTFHRSARRFVHLVNRSAGSGSGKPEGLHYACIAKSDVVQPFRPAQDV
jgi:hypothetical protein